MTDSIGYRHNLVDAVNMRPSTVSFPGLLLRPSVRTVSRERQCSLETDLNSLGRSFHFIGRICTDAIQRFRCIACIFFFLHGEKIWCQWIQGNYLFVEKTKKYKTLTATGGKPPTDCNFKIYGGAVIFQVN